MKMEREGIRNKKVGVFERMKFKFEEGFFYLNVILL